MSKSYEAVGNKSYAVIADVLRSAVQNGHFHEIWYWFWLCI